MAELFAAPSGSQDVLPDSLVPISAAVASALGSFSASAVDFHGYFRAGVQNNLTSGGAVYCFGTGNAGHLMGRLGDECDTYAELALTQEVFNKAKNKFTVNTLVAVSFL